MVGRLGRQSLAALPATGVLQRLAERCEEVDLIGRQSVLNQRLRQHAAKVRLNIAHHFRSFLFPAHATKPQELTVKLSNFRPDRRCHPL